MVTVRSPGAEVYGKFRPKLWGFSCLTHRGAGCRVPALQSYARVFCTELETQPCISQAAFDPNTYREAILGKKKKTCYFPMLTVHCEHPS